MLERQIDGIEPLEQHLARLTLERNGRTETVTVDLTALATASGERSRP